MKFTLKTSFGKAGEHPYLVEIVCTNQKPIMKPMIIGGRTQASVLRQAMEHIQEILKDLD